MSGGRCICREKDAGVNLVRAKIIVMLSVVDNFIKRNVCIKMKHWIWLMNKRSIEATGWRVPFTLHPQ